MKRIIYSLLVMLAAVSCDVDVEDTSPNSYAEFMSEGWILFSQTYYDSSYHTFADAIKKYPDSADVYTGAGWALMKMDSLNKAGQTFTTGSTKVGTDVDFYAGWSFCENARRQFSSSNEKLMTALSLKPTWSFPYAGNIGASDLKAMKAENYFMMGDFGSSLAAVQVLDPNFTADIQTDTGIGELAVKIEALKKAN